MMNRLVSGLLVTLAIAIPAHAAVKESTVKSAPKSARSATKTPVVVPVHEAPAPAVLSAEQLAIAERVQVGTSRCELAVVVTVRADTHTAGRFILDAGHKRYSLDPVVTSTGAVRLEDVSSGAVWIQLANKSMLMNQRLGQRIADDCMNPQQALVAQALLKSPAPHLLDAPNEALVPVMPGKVAQEMVPNTIK
nr:hypothetical protein [Rhodoferax sp.]